MEGGIGVRKWRVGWPVGNQQLASVEDVCSPGLRKALPQAGIAASGELIDQPFVPSREPVMANRHLPPIVSRAEWRVARAKLLVQEKESTRTRATLAAGQRL